MRPTVDIVDLRCVDYVWTLESESWLPHFNALARSSAIFPIFKFLSTRSAHKRPVYDILFSEIFHGPEVLILLSLYSMLVKTEIRRLSMVTCWDAHSPLAVLALNPLPPQPTVYKLSFHLPHLLYSRYESFLLIFILPGTVQFCFGRLHKQDRDEITLSSFGGAT